MANHPPFAYTRIQLAKTFHRTIGSTTMKTSMNLLLWTTHVTAEHFPILAKLKETGYDGVEIPLFEDDPKHYEKVRKELDKLGLGCTCVTVATADANPISPDPAVRKAAVQRLANMARNTSILGGAFLCGPYHQPLGVFSGEPPTEQEKHWVADTLRAAADEAQKVKVKLVVEYLNRFECYFLTTAADAKALVQRVNHSNFKTMWDTFHANIEEKDVAKTLASVADNIVHVHVSENDRGTPGTGHVNFVDTFKTLHKVGYDGWLVIEAFGRALPALAAATKVWRDLFPSAEEVYTQGLRFMKKLWAETA
jgi:D-psicose/D-tagatose/L-ribulose 3-epimerase